MYKNKRFIIKNKFPKDMFDPIHLESLTDYIQHTTEKMFVDDDSMGLYSM